MQKSLRGKLILAIALCGLFGTAAHAQTTSGTTTTTTPDSVTGTDPVPISPNAIDIILLVLQTVV